LDRVLILGFSRKRQFLNGPPIPAMTQSPHLQWKRNLRAVTQIKPVLPAEVAPDGETSVFAAIALCNAANPERRSSCDPAEARISQLESTAAMLPHQ
jgi:hypothetical protein